MTWGGLYSGMTYNSPSLPAGRVAVPPAMPRCWACLLCWSRAHALIQAWKLGDIVGFIPWFFFLPGYQLSGSENKKIQVKQADTNNYDSHQMGIHFQHPTRFPCLSNSHGRIFADTKFCRGDGKQVSGDGKQLQKTHEWNFKKKKKERLEKVLFWLWKSSEISFCSFFFCYMIQYLKLKHLVGNLLVLLNNMSQHEDFPQTNDQNKNDLKPLKVC